MRQVLLAFGILLFSAISAGEESSLQRLIPEAYRSSCQVRVWNGFITTGDRCFMDEVMVGIDSSVTPIRIRCARIEVTCNRGEAHEPRDN